MVKVVEMCYDGFVKIGGACYVVLVGDAVLRFINPGHNADWWKSDVEALSQFDQWPVRIPDTTLHEEYGHMEICP